MDHVVIPIGKELQIVGKIVAATRPFRFHAHGYGFFAGAEPSELCLHVPVVRNVGLDPPRVAVRGAHR
jgi:hypothetical protein